MSWTDHADGDLSDDQEADHPMASVLPTAYTFSALAGVGGAAVAIVATLGLVFGTDRTIASASTDPTVAPILVVGVSSTLAIGYVAWRLLRDEPAEE